MLVGVGGHQLVGALSSDGLQSRAMLVCFHLALHAWALQPDAEEPAAQQLAGIPTLISRFNISHEKAQEHDLPCVLPLK